MIEIHEELIIICPHCQLSVIIEKLNCCIFRHGIMKNSGIQMDPHTPQNICDDLIKSQLIFGCGKPFKIIKKDNVYIAEICEYI